MVSFSKTETNHFQSKVFLKKIEQTKPFLVKKKHVTDGQTIVSVLRFKIVEKI